MAEAGQEPQPLANTVRGAIDEGWFYEEDDLSQRICLTGLDRMIGDVYDIVILTTDKLDATTGHEPTVTE